MQEREFALIESLTKEHQFKVKQLKSSKVTVTMLDCELNLSNVFGFTNGDMYCLFGYQYQDKEEVSTKPETPVSQKQTKEPSAINSQNSQKSKQEEDQEHWIGRMRTKEMGDSDFQKIYPSSSQATERPSYHSNSSSVVDEEVQRTIQSILRPSESLEHKEVPVVADRNEEELQTLIHRAQEDGYAAYKENSCYNRQKQSQTISNQNDEPRPRHISSKLFNILMDSQEESCLPTSSIDSQEQQVAPTEQTELIISDQIITDSSKISPAKLEDLKKLKKWGFTRQSKLKIFKDLANEGPDSADNLVLQDGWARNANGKFTQTEKKKEKQLSQLNIKIGCDSQFGYLVQAVTLALEQSTQRHQRLNIIKNRRNLGISKDPTNLELQEERAAYKGSLMQRHNPQAVEFVHRNNKKLSLEISSSGKSSTQKGPAKIKKRQNKQLVKLAQDETKVKTGFNVLKKVADANQRPSLENATVMSNPSEDNTLMSELGLDDRLIRISQITYQSCKSPPQLDFTHDTIESNSQTNKKETQQETQKDYDQLGEDSGKSTPVPLSLEQHQITQENSEKSMNECESIDPSLPLAQQLLDPLDPIKIDDQINIELSGEIHVELSGTIVQYNKPLSQCSSQINQS